MKELMKVNTKNEILTFLEEMRLIEKNTNKNEFQKEYSTFILNDECCQVDFFEETFFDYFLKNYINLFDFESLCKIFKPSQTKDIIYDMLNFLDKNINVYVID